MTRNLTIAAILAALPFAVPAQEVETHVLNEMELTPTPLDGVASTMVGGAMDDDGAFAAQAVMADGAVFPPHDHPDARVSLVLEGTMYLGTGEIVDEAAERAFQAGSVAITPAGVMHWMAARDGDVRILEIGTGPTETRWAEPPATQ